MADYFIHRQPSTPDGTLGEFVDSLGEHVCYTIELTWNNNEPDTSSIPAGDYTVIPHNSAAHPNVWEVANVPGRAGILIHNGNTENDSKGCIIVGDSEGKINGLPAVLNSDKMLALLRNELPQTFTLTITDYE